MSLQLHLYSWGISILSCPSQPIRLTSIAIDLFRRDCNETGILILVVKGCLDATATICVYLFLRGNLLDAPRDSQESFALIGLPSQVADVIEPQG